MTAPLFISFNVHIGSETETITSADLESVADAYFLNLHAAGRYSWLFVLDMLMYERVYGISPFQITDEIRGLERSESATRTKPASRFSRKPLEGLWHKHFFSARFMAHNIVNHLGGGKLERLVDEIFKPDESPVVTEKMINELAHRATIESFEQRASDGRLTGEWIVFAKHEGENYYLCLATHRVSDQSIYDKIKAVCWREFPFLVSKTGSDAEIASQIETENLADQPPD
ncbi:MAG: hypothetical protein LCH99_13765 [Proteobacteria bacterium]|nr:hypothetical protein [Pseudomonadota bacterium]